MNQLQINLFEKEFNNKQVRILTDDNNKIWFVGLDIAKILEYKDTNASIRNNVDDEDKIKLKNFNNPEKFSGFHLDTILIDESGFYSLVLRSKKNNANRFRRCVTSEVLPSIRKTGKYEIEKSNK